MYGNRAMFSYHRIKRQLLFFHFSDGIADIFFIEDIKEMFQILVVPDYLLE